VFENNQRGAVRYTSAGEINPILTMARNQFIDNCEDLYGNYSSCQSAIFLDVQNTRDVFFHNNFVSRNMGGLFLRAGSSGSATSLKGVLHNNVFSENRKRVSLHLEGRQTSPYQEIRLYRNYMTRNNVSHEPVVQMNQVVCNATWNTFFNNRGKEILYITGFDNVRLPIYQKFIHNGFHNNFAYGLHCDRTTLKRCAWGSRATVVAGSAGMEFVDNIFYNRENDYELVTLNRSMFDVWKTPINAKYNYWGYNETYAVAGRIKDLHDVDGLLEVDFTPFQMNNKTLMSGKCHPGWTLLGDTCFMYHGAPMSFSEAKSFCAKDNASMPYLMERYYLIHRYLETQQADWRYYDMVWVQHLDSPSTECTAFVDGGVDSVSCEFLLPTLCELDPHVNPGFSIHHLEDYVTIASLCAAIGCILLIVLICVLWCSKSRTRKKERFERRNSIRLSKSSLGSRSLASMQSAGFSDINYRRRMVSQSNSRQPSIVATNPYGEYKVAGSTDSLDKRMAGLNSTVDTSATYDIYGGQLAAGGSVQQFADLHDVHYAPGGSNGHAATIHTPANKYEGFENRAYRPETRQSLLQPEPGQGGGQVWAGRPGQADGLSLGGAPPGYTSSPRLADTVGSRGDLEADSSNTSDHTATTEADQEYQQVLDQEFPPQPVGQQQPDPGYGHSTFRPASQATSPGYGSSAATLQLRPGQQQPDPQLDTGIVSVPGYAKPFQHSQYVVKPGVAPPEPPAGHQRPRSALVRTAPAPIETCFDDPEPLSLPPAPQTPQESSRMLRTKSVGEILETNFDECGDSEPILARQPPHSRSMQLLNSGKLGIAANLLETDM